MLIIGSAIGAIGMSVILVSVHRIRKRKSNEPSLNTLPPRTRHLSAVDELLLGKEIPRKEIPSQPVARKMAVPPYKRKEMRISRTNTSLIQKRNLDARSPISARDLNTLLFQFMQGARGLRVQTKLGVVPTTKYIRIPLIFTIQEKKESMDIRVEVHPNRMLLSYQYVYLSGELVLSVDYTPSASKQKVYEFLRQVIKEFGQPAPLGVKPSLPSYKKPSNRYMPNIKKVSTPLSRAKIPLSDEARTLVDKLESLLNTFRQNKATDALTIEGKHRVEVLEKDYHKLLRSFQASNEVSMDKKEEVLLMGLRLILDKLTEVYVHIGESEYKEMLRQLSIIDQR